MIIEDHLQIYRSTDRVHGQFAVVQLFVRLQQRKGKKLEPLTEIERFGLTNQVAQHNQLADERDDERDGVVRKLSYNLKTLVWDAKLLTNNSNKYCYYYVCGVSLFYF